MDINIGWWYLLGCVLSSSLIPIIFREVQRFPVPLFQVITWNYVVCVLTGLIFAPEFFEVVAQSDKSWVPLGVFQGALFITLFFMIARGVQTLGIVIAVILTKLSVIIPTLLSWVIYDDPMNGLRWAGVALALVAIVLLNLRTRGRHTPDEPEQQLKPRTRKLDKALLLALVLFFGSATTDSVFKIFNAEYGA
ncbi:MAG: EamA family transporter, partial [Bacteroidota bacterium]